MLVSFVLAPYGAWLFDLVVLLVPVLTRAARLEGTGVRRGWAAFAAVEGSMLALKAARANLFAFIGVAPLILLAWWWLGRRPNPSSMKGTGG